jgi:plasmid stabilization system protein ParE
VIAYTPRATRQVKDLIQHYEDRGRPEAIRTFLAALDEAERKIAGNPAAGLAAPRPYPRLIRRNRAWVKAGRYWITYRTTLPLMIAGVFYETADIPNRL